MSDPRASNVQRFCQDQAARRVLILTALSPFTVSQDRLLVIMPADGPARLIVCLKCTPRTAFDHGETRSLAAEEQAAFMAAVEAAAGAWTADSLPPEAHDGITLTVEQATADDYHRVRIVAPPPGSPHAALLAAWTDHLPEARRLVR